MRNIVLNSGTENGRSRLLNGRLLRLMQPVRLAAICRTSHDTLQSHPILPPVGRRTWQRRHFLGRYLDNLVNNSQETNLFLPNSSTWQSLVVQNGKSTYIICYSRKRRHEDLPASLNPLGHPFCLPFSLAFRLQSLLLQNRARSRSCVHSYDYQLLQYTANIYIFLAQ